MSCLWLVWYFGKFIRFWVKMGESKYFWYGTFRFSVTSMGFADVFIYDYFANICKYCQVLCCCVLKTQYFLCVQIICIFYKSVCTKITIFFHFFQTIASCDHQLTSEGQLLRPFSLLFAILLFVYDFHNRHICKLNIFNSTFRCWSIIHCCAHCDVYVLFLEIFAYFQNSALLWF